MSTDLENNDTGVNSKPKSHVTIRWEVLEEIGNWVTTRATQAAQKIQNTKALFPPTKTTNVNKHLKPTASVKPVQMDVLAPKVGNSEFTSILNRVASLGLWCKGTFIVTVTFEEH